jgi:hypothetical protein
MNEHQSFVTIFVVIGILAIMGGAYFTYSQISFLNKCEKARGTVVDIFWEIAIENGKEVEYSYPIFEFVDAKGSGATILARGRVGSNPPDNQIGDVVDILYDLEDPKNVYRDDFWDIWMGPIIAFSLGSAFILVAMLVKRVPMERFT